MNDIKTNTSQSKKKSSNYRPKKYSSKKTTKKSRPSSDSTKKKFEKSPNTKSEPANKKRNYSSGKPRKFNRRPKSPKSAIESMLKKYEYLMSLHLAARKKRHDLYYKADVNQKRKLDKNFNSTIEQVDKLVSTLSPQQRVALDNHIVFFKKDTSYSESNPEADIIDSIPQPEEIVDPHYLNTQEESSFCDDIEDSSGTMEDYKKYKGI